MGNPIDIQIGANIRAARQLKGWGQDQLGRSLSEPCTYQQIQKYERGINRCAASRLLEIAKLLDTDIGSLCGGVGSRIEEMDHGARNLMANYRRINSDEAQKAVRNLVHALVTATAAKLTGVDYGRN